MADLDKIQVSDSYYDIKDKLARPLVFNIDNGTTINLNGMTVADIAERILQGGYVGLQKDGVLYMGTSATSYYSNNVTFYTLNFETLNASRNIVRYVTSVASTATSFTVNGPTTYNLTLQTSYCTGTLDTSSTGTSITIPSGYESGTLIIFGRPGNGNYTSVSIPITKLPQIVQLANQTNYVSYSVTKSDDTVKFVLNNQSASSTVDAVYIKP